MNASNSILVILIFAIILGGLAIFSRSQPNNQSATVIPTPTITETGEPTIEPTVSPAISAGLSPTNLPKGGTIVELSAIGGNENGQSGIASINEEAGKVVVSIAIDTKENTNSPQPANIYSGNCTNLGRIAYPLSNVENGRSETTLNTTLSRLEGQLPLAISVKKSSSENNVNVSCGNMAF